MSRKRKAPNASSALDLPQCINKRQALSQLKRRMREFELHFRTDKQRIFYNTIKDNDLTFCAGPAGSGKTFIAVAYALQLLANRTNPVDGIVITKPLVEASGEKIGFLPGDVDEKTDPFMMSYWCNMHKLIEREVLNVLTYSKVIEVIPMAYMRGVTLDNKIVILDEAQNATPEQMKMLLTRIGDKSQYIICGDIEQTDRKDTNGLLDGLLRFANMDNVGICTFDKEDIVRNPIITHILDRYALDIPDRDIKQFGEVGDGGGDLSVLYQKFIKPKDKSDISILNNKG
tara:strand:+ start:6792 stop:7652 length:861 start_codon:yes stop_codon:yes gene_type:complete